MTDSTRDFFDMLARVLLRCWIFGFVLSFIWLGAFLSGTVHVSSGEKLYQFSGERSVS
jgi:hypothetical protein